MFLMAAILFVGIAACGGETTTETTATTQTTQTTQTTATTTTETTTENTLPVLFGVEDALVYVGDTFDPLAGVMAMDAEDGNLTASIVQTGTLDLNTAGDYTLTYTITDSSGGETVATRVISVLALDLVYPSGVYNFKFETTDLRHTFMAAAEKYLMNNMYGGVPLFANGGFNVYSSRLQLPVSEYVAVMGFGTGFSTMSADDSTVLMDNGQPGNAGEYTYRTTISTNPGTWNQWLYDTSTDSDLMGVYMDALYTYQFNDDKTGYEVVPSMAASDPAPIDSRETETGKTVSRTWQITLRDDLEWYYHDDTDVSGLAAGHEVIDANDFVDTFKLALDEQWFRAISGGGDFITSSNKIKNAQAYVDGNADWADVGIKKIDDLTFEFEFVDEQSDWNVRYFLSSFVMTPINIELYNSLQDGTNNSYGTSNTTIAYHGAYYVDYFEADKILRYEKNPEYHTPNEYFFTGYTFSVIEDSDVRFQEFVAGKLEAASVPTQYYDAYKNYPGIKQVPGSTTFRLMINGLGTIDDQRDEFPTGSWEPEPLLANDDFKMAMFFAIDRQKLAEQVLKTSTTQMYLFSDAYLVEAELGIPYRQTSQGQAVGEGLSPSTFGYNRDAAEAYWNSAIDQLVADGDYEPGTQSEYTVIKLGFNIFSGSIAQSLLGDYIETTFENTFISYEHNIKVDVTVEPKDFPGIYYDYMMVGEFDLSIGGISGSTLDAASFLDVFADDNRGGFTLNWGIDTSTANIEVLYETVDGVRHLEMWSYNAIVSALNGTVYIEDGEEAVVPYASITDQSPYGATFTINEYNNLDYENITYTVQIYNAVTETYEDLTGFVDLAPTSDEVTVTGLEPFYDGYYPNGEYIYKGDYRIKVNYEVVESGELGSSVSSWFATDYLTGNSGYSVWAAWYTGAFDYYLAGAGVVLAPTAIYIDFALDVDATGTYDSLEVYSSANVDITDTLTIDDTDLAAISIEGLEADTSYFVKFVLDDGTFEYYELFTKPIASFNSLKAETNPSVAKLASYTMGGVVLSDTDGVTRTITGARILDTSKEVVTGATIDYSDLTAVVVDGLVANTTYYVEFTYDTTEVQLLAIKTANPINTTDTEEEVTVDSININLVLTDDGVTTLTVTDVNVFKALDESEVTAVIDFTDLTDISITGLEEFTRYLVEVEFSDGSTATLEIDTALDPYSE
jgi:ABC-type oligopeptide transport system substrate-binding subunit